MAGSASMALDNVVLDLVLERWTTQDGGKLEAYPTYWQKPEITELTYQA